MRFSLSPLEGVSEDEHCIRFVVSWIGRMSVLETKPAGMNDELCGARSAWRTLKSQPVKDMHEWFTLR